MPMVGKVKIVLSEKIVLLLHPLCLCDDKNATSLAVADEHGKRHTMPSHKPQAVSDWLNPHSLGTI